MRTSNVGQNQIICVCLPKIINLARREKKHRNWDNIGGASVVITVLFDGHDDSVFKLLNPRENLCWKNLAGRKRRGRQREKKNVSKYRETNNLPEDYDRQHETTRSPCHY